MSGEALRRLREVSLVIVEWWLHLSRNLVHPLAPVSIHKAAMTQCLQNQYPNQRRQLQRRLLSQ